MIPKNKMSCELLAAASNRLSKEWLNIDIESRLLGFARHWSTLGHVLHQWMNDMSGWHLPGLWPLTCSGLWFLVKRNLKCCSWQSSLPLLYGIEIYWFCSTNCVQPNFLGPKDHSLSVMIFSFYLNSGSVPTLFQFFLPGHFFHFHFHVDRH